MVSVLLLAVGVWVGSWPTASYCSVEVAPGVYTQCVAPVGEVVDTELGLTSTVWRLDRGDGTAIEWEGNPFCAEMGLFPTSELVLTDDGNWVRGDSIGACRYPRRISTNPAVPIAPSGVVVSVQ